MPAQTSTARSEPRQTSAHDPRAPVAGTPAWLGPFFSLAAASPGLTTALRPLACRLLPVLSSRVRDATRRNARRIFGRELSPADQRRFSRAVAGGFYDFVRDISRSATLGPDQMRATIERVEGLEAYRAARRERRGAVLVTAHLGTFEIGLAALVGEESRVRVVFKRDASPVFERLRSCLRERLSVVEAPIDDGWSSWMPLRDALLADEVVVMQGDRAIPGQRSEVLPFLHGHLRVPTGPVRLARLTGSPIIPVFSPRLPGGRTAVILGSPIQPSESGADLAALARAIERVIAQFPEQWLAFEPVFDEDARDAP